MINSAEIDSKAAEFKISPRNVERDYVFGWILNGIYKNPILSRQLILKGGNALRKGYLANTRFSKDLDFSVREQVNPAELQNELKSILTVVHEQTGVNFLLDKTEVKEKLVIDGRQVYEGRTVFQGFYEEEEAKIRIHMDVTEFDRVILPTQRPSLIHPYSDAAACQSEIHCHKLEEVLASKLVGLLHRRKAADIFDLAYAIIRNSDFSVNRSEVLTTFLKKTIYESQPQVAKEQLQGLAIEESRPFWSDIIAPISVIFEFDEAVRQFNELIALLFSLVPAPAFAPAGYGRPTTTRPVSYGGGYSGGISYYGNDFREIIMKGLESSTMLNLLYDGEWRLVEPYELRYHVRKKDNRGIEYFWAYDTSGGNSGKIGIKQFISDKIQDMELTSYSFTPRYF